MIPIDKTRNCEMMLVTKQYQTEIYKNKEDVWLIYYLKKKYENGIMDKKKCHDIILTQWIEIFLTRFEDPTDTDVEFAEVHFDSIYRNLGYVDLNKKYKKIVIYKEEIDYINSLPVSYWLRQFILLLLGHTKTINSCIYEYAPIQDYMRFLRLKTKNRDVITDTIYKKMRQFGIWVDSRVVTKRSATSKCCDGLYYTEEDDIEFKFEFRLPVDGKTKIATFASQLDLIEAMDSLLIETYNCDICGKPFVIGNRTQRTICENCWKDKEKIRKREVWRKAHKKEN